MLAIDGVTKRYTFKEAQEAIEKGDMLEAIVAINWTDLIEDMNNFDDFWDRLITDSVDADYVEHEGMDHRFIGIDETYEALLFKVTIDAINVEKYN